MKHFLLSSLVIISTLGMGCTPSDSYEPNLAKPKSSHNEDGYVLLLNDVRKPLLNTRVKGYVLQGHAYIGTDLDRNANVPYIHFWTYSGRYIRWTGDYLYSNEQFQITVNPLIK